MVPSSQARIALNTRTLSAYWGHRTLTPNAGPTEPLQARHDLSYQAGQMRTCDVQMWIESAYYTITVRQIG